MFDFSRIGTRGRVMDAMVFGLDCVDRDGLPQRHEGELDWVGDARDSSDPDDSTDPD